MRQAMRSAIGGDEDRTLLAGALGFGESAIMGVAGSAPAYSVATTTAQLVGVVGILAPASMLYCGLLMFGVVFAFRHLNRVEVNAGTSYAWVGKIFSPAFGFFAGWALITSSVLFMVAGIFPAATGTLQLLAPALTNDQQAVSLVAAVWIVVIGTIVAKGIKPSSYVQIAFTGIETGVLGLIIVLALAGLGPPPAHKLSLASLAGAGFTPGGFAGGALVALFALSGWDVAMNLGEETRDGGRAAGAGSILAVVIVIGLMIGFEAVVLLTLNDAEIQKAGLNIVFVVAGKFFPHPWDDIAVVAVMLSTVGTLETSILQFARTMFSMGRDGVFHQRYARLHRTYRTPWLATLIITALGLILLLLSLLLPGINTVVNDSINAISFQTAVYYSLTGFACAWYFIRRAFTSAGSFILLFAWPLVGAAACVFIGVGNLPTFDTTTKLLAVGTLALGIVPYLWLRWGSDGAKVPTGARRPGRLDG
jgi:amino acid transporter